ncbi:hypothetical protein GCM10020331_082740 [Ectobacillus funiculus]
MRMRNLNYQGSRWLNLSALIWICWMPKKVNKPTEFDYIAGIESYEYSEEAMYEVVEKSGLGLHLLNGPVVEKMAKEAGKTKSSVIGRSVLCIS